MLGSIFTGLSGLMGFSKGLDVISDNVANMNTPGYKSKTLQFEELFNQAHLTATNNGTNKTVQIGGGVKVGATTTSFAQGELRSTGNQTDAAVNGNGYFILREGVDTYYTRAGQFTFDNNGFLVSSQNGQKVAGIQGSSRLVDINIQDFRVNPPAATTSVQFVKNLSTGSKEHEITDLKVFDLSGEQHTLKVVFDKGDPNSPLAARHWEVEVFDSNDVSIGVGEIHFQGDGTPEEGFNTVDISYTPPDGAEFTFTLDFGEPGSISGATGNSGGTSSNLAIGTVDGYGVGSIINTLFDTKGNLEVEYSNAQKLKPFRLALAHFENQQSLQSVGQGLLVNAAEQDVIIGKPGDGVMGSLVGGSIEMSNVELTEEFTDLVITQRGYQASSQVLTVANEMIQQLLDAGKSR